MYPSNLDATAWRPAPDLGLANHCGYLPPLMGVQISAITSGAGQMDAPVTGESREGRVSAR